MGTYVNPDNDGFFEAISQDCYIDKTGLIAYFNSVLSTPGKEIMFSRPRRFGKTTACKMLEAYYSIGAKSARLFKGLRIEKDPTFEGHLNKHPVISFDLLAFKDNWENPDNDWSDFNNKKPTLVQYLQRKIMAEMTEEYPDAPISMRSSLHDAMLAVSNFLKAREKEQASKQKDVCRELNLHKFIVIIDEWDLVLRENKDSLATVEEYVQFLRALFRSRDTSFYLAGAYMTGILPIIRYNTQTALSDFFEYTMLEPLMLAEYVGFTREDVHKVCQKFKADEGLMKAWYDGYDLPGAGEVYCPASVMKAAKSKKYKGYWPKTSAMEALTDYIYMNLDGLQETMDRLLDGKEEDIDPEVFENRLDRVETRDDVLTVLVHLGHLAYDDTAGTVRIPNLEVRQQMLYAFSKAPNEEFFKRVKRCEKALKATKGMDGLTVAQVLKEIHDERPPIHYNDEQALRYVVLQAFNNSPNAMFEAFEELSSGQGFVDILFKPLKRSREIPMLVELKHGESTGKAINQIEKKDYIAHLRKEEYQGDVLLVGINYSPGTKGHTCRIEKIRI